MAELHDKLQAALGERYQVEKEIGQGGMAVVFRALDRKHNRTVAVKVLRPELASALGPERFLREIEIAAKLQHPHVLPVYDSGEADGLLYYVMPFVPGESLRDRLVRTGPLPPEEALRVTREVAAALDYAHRQGIVHRDIKPANILISDGHAVVADFGIARAVTAAQGGLTQAGMAIGTPSYMSPEQALGEQNLDGRTDIYALGCVLYEMLAGNPPYEGTTPQTVIAKALAGKPPKLEQDPLGLRPVIAQALEREPSDRFATAADLMRALDAVTTGSGYRARRGRRRWGLLAAAATVVIAVAAVLLWPRGFQAAGNPRLSLIVFPFENQTGDSTLDYLENGAMNLLGLAAAQWEDMRVYDDERTASLLRRKHILAAADLDFDQAQALARDAKVGTLVLGDIRREGDSLTVEAKVHDVRSGDRLDTEIERAPWGADPRPVFDRLAARMLRISGAQPGERPDLATQTTRSLEAYQAYLTGVGYLQHFLLDSARAEFERAIALDSTFALAYVRLRDAVGWETSGPGGVGNPALRRELITKAERYSGSLPPRLKSLIQFYGAYEAGTMDRAREIAREMIARDSTDVEAWYQLGEAHFHDRSTVIAPRERGWGNVGTALRAFQHALRLDSSYVMAYRHILDGLSLCATPTSAILCLADSAVYGFPPDIVERYGQATVDSLKAEARAAQVATARGWVSVEPALPMAHAQLAQALAREGLYSEARSEDAELRRLGEPAAAEAVSALIAAYQGRYAEAGNAVARALATGDTITVLQSGALSQLGVNLLVAAGRVHEARLFGQTLFRVIPVDSFPGPGGVNFPKSAVPALMASVIFGQLGQPSDSASAAIQQWFDIVDRMFANDTTKHRALTEAYANLALLGYLADRDTLLLHRVLATADTSGDRLRILRAQMALERGDTATARRWANALRTDLPGYWKNTGPPQMVGWADILARLGDYDLALTGLAHLDSLDVGSSLPALQVRSLADRASLLQRLGRTTEAIAMYERFIDSWRDADPMLQSAVERARRTVEALRGESRRPTDRE